MRRKHGSGRESALTGTRDKAIEPPAGVCVDADVELNPPERTRASGRCRNSQAGKPALRGAAILAAGSGGVHRPVPAKAVSRFACHSSPKRQTLADGLTWHGVQFEYADTSTL